MAELLGLVADALEVGDGLDDRDDQAQVGGRRAARREDAAAIVVDRHLHRVDLVVEARDLLAEPAVALDEGLDAVLQLLLDEAAHLQHAGAHALEVGVVAAQDVVGQVGRFHAAPPGSRFVQEQCAGITERRPPLRHLP